MLLIRQQEVGPGRSGDPCSIYILLSVEVDPSSCMRWLVPVLNRKQSIFPHHRSREDVWGLRLLQRARLELGRCHVRSTCVSARLCPRTLSLPFSRLVPLVPQFHIHIPTCTCICTCPTIPSSLSHLRLHLNVDLRISSSPCGPRQSTCPSGALPHVTSSPLHVAQHSALFPYVQGRAGR